MQIISNVYEDFVCRDLERYVKWHRRAIDYSPHQYEVCAELISEVVSQRDSKKKILNVCAGNGSLVSYLNQRFPEFEFVGTDTLLALIEDNSAAQVQSSNVKLIHAPIESLGSQSSQYDICVHWMRLLHFADWQGHISGMIKSTKPGGHILVSSLFNDHDADLLATVLDYNIPTCREGYCLQYNTFSCAQVEKFCYANGATKVKFYPYEIPFDIPRQESGVGSYTVKIADGKRETISGGLRMQWQILHIQL
ncbi:MAG: class I SAM-dependent methyltransferase [Coleofasciculus chthonoplastes F3-SA18-01]|uniref:class I SAM-dependent methyltransferase n=1 Tax=Coleofasciculus chthonoplastes TaxID=64178 RepID=UPI0032F18AC3